MPFMPGAGQEVAVTWGRWLLRACVLLWLCPPGHLAQKQARGGGVDLTLCVAADGRLMDAYSAGCTQALPNPWHVLIHFIIPPPSPFTEVIMGGVTEGAPVDSQVEQKRRLHGEGVVDSRLREPPGRGRERPGSWEAAGSGRETPHSGQKSQSVGVRPSVSPISGGSWPGTRGLCTRQNDKPRGLCKNTASTTHSLPSNKH